MELYWSSAKKGVAVGLLLTLISYVGVYAAYYAFEGAHTLAIVYPNYALVSKCIEIFSLLTSGPTAVSSPPSLAVVLLTMPLTYGAIFGFIGWLFSLTKTAPHVGTSGHVGRF